MVVAPVEAGEGRSGGRPRMRGEGGEVRAPVLSSRRSSSAIGRVVGEGFGVILGGAGAPWMRQGRAKLC
jgi:hypothetical protein